MVIIWAAGAFLCGSLPFSVWIGRLALGKEIVQVGDGNPGAANVWRAGGAGWGTLAIVLDFLKGAIPVALAVDTSGLEGLPLAAVAVSPIAGHAFSPFLRFRGGKALAVSFGVWSGLTLWLIPSILGLFFGLFLSLLRPNAWAVVAGMLSLFIVLLLIGNPLWLAVWVGMVLIVGWKHRKELEQRPELRRRWSR